LSEKGEGKLVLLVTQRCSDFLKERFVAPVILNDTLNPRDFALKTELGGGGENPAKSFFR
jgi:hypothetical protein